jgi:phosphatidylglycerol---prolipoprotein diacylglyceryl transferase
MYPDLSYFFNDFFNTPIDNWTSVFKTNGVLLAFTFGICSIVLKNELKRREAIGLIKNINPSQLIQWAENSFLIALSAVTGYKMVHIALNLNAFKSNSRGMILSWEGNIYGGLFFILCAVCTIFFNYKETKSSEKKKKSFYKLSTHLTVFTIIIGLIFNKLFGILEVDFEGKTFYQIFNNSGTNFFGGLFGGILGGFIFCKLYKIPFHNLLDSIAPIMMLGYAIGRLSCHLPGDGCWGIDNPLTKPNWFILPQWLWSCNYPRNITNKGVNMVDTIGVYNKILETPVFPTPLYEAILGFIMFLILWRMRKKVIKPYLLFTYFLLLMGVERFLIEFIRINSTYYFIGLHLSQAQFISLFLILVSISFLLYTKLKIKIHLNSTPL